MSFVIGLAAGLVIGGATGLFLGAVCVLLAQRGDAAIEEALTEVFGGHADDCMTVIDEALLCDCQGAAR